MRINTLWGKHNGASIVIIGTGPSLRVFPRKRLELLSDNCITIGLNQAWRYCNVTYLITIHPHEREVIPEESHRRTKYTLVTKRKGPKGHWASRLSFDDPDTVVFECNKDPHDFTFCEKRYLDKLYCGLGIQASAITLAAHMGAYAVTLIGCDMAPLGGDHHGTPQHIRLHGLSENDVYNEYYECTAKVRSIVREAFGTDVMTLSPFLGCKHAEVDYRRLRAEQGLEPHDAPIDTSGYTRDVHRFVP